MQNIFYESHTTISIAILNSSKDRRLSVADCIALNNALIFTARCTIVHSAVLRLHGVRLSVRLSDHLSVRL